MQWRAWCYRSSRDLVKKITGTGKYPCLTGNKLPGVQTDANGPSDNTSLSTKIWRTNVYCTSQYIGEIDIWKRRDGGTGGSGGAIAEKD